MKIENLVLTSNGFLLSPEDLSQPRVTVLVSIANVGAGAAFLGEVFGKREDRARTDLSK